MRKLFENEVRKTSNRIMSKLNESEDSLKDKVVKIKVGNNTQEVYVHGDHTGAPYLGNKPTIFYSNYVDGKPNKYTRSMDKDQFMASLVESTNSSNQDIETGYIDNLDITVIFKHTYNEARDNIISTEVVGFYHGEPDDTATDSYMGSLIAEY